MKCQMCEKNINVFGTKIHTADGVICGDCAEKIPQPFRDSAKAYTCAELKDIIKYEEMLRDTEFSETSSLGELKIDDMHGLFAIGDETSVYSVLSVTDFSISGENYHESRSHSGKLVCDAVFDCEISNPRIHIKKTVMKGIECAYERVSHDHVQPKVPGVILVMNDVFSQMYKNQAEKLTSVYNTKFADRNSIDIMESELILMMHDGYERSDVDAQEKTLLDAYEGHPDREYYQKRIRKAADTLRMKLSREAS